MRTRDYTDQNEEPIRLYSERSVAIGTYLGGPLAAGILMRRNFINTGKKQYGDYALITGIFSTILLIVIIITIPENVLDKIPNALIPAIYTFIGFLLMRYLQSADIEQHKNNNGDMFSAWRAAGVGTIYMLVFLTSIFVSVLLIDSSDGSIEYDNKIAEFQSNEEKAMEFFTLLQNDEKMRAANYIRDVGLPLWQKNLQIMAEIDKIDIQNKELIKQNHVLREYCNLRIRSFELIQLALIEDTEIYDLEIERLLNDIEVTLSQL